MVARAGAKFAAEFEAMACASMSAEVMFSGVMDDIRAGRTTGVWFFSSRNRYSACDMHTVRAIYPGTFDPPTNGHLDLIARGAKIVDELVVAILRNSDKGTPLFSVPERLEMMTEAIDEFPNVKVTTFDGLLVDFARQQGRRRCCAEFAPFRTMSTSSRWR